MDSFDARDNATKQQVRAGLLNPIERDLPYQRLTKKAEALIASVCLAGINRGG